ncbi:hypothetical protein IG631_05661 [Alternaria alternata]|nr:hypothetical protein IG631_05661 [Alternaria alternata]
MVKQGSVNTAKDQYVEEQMKKLHLVEILRALLPHEHNQQACVGDCDDLCVRRGTSLIQKPSPAPSGNSCEPDIQVKRRRYVRMSASNEGTLPDLLTECFRRLQYSKESDTKTLATSWVHMRSMAMHRCETNDGVKMGRKS